MIKTYQIKYKNNSKNQIKNFFLDYLMKWWGHILYVKTLQHSSH